MIVSTHPLAEDELVESTRYYSAEGSPELATDFVAEFERLIKLLQEYPKLGSPWGGKIRKMPMRRFPYSVVYSASSEAVRVLAIAHQKRKPGYWRGRK